MCQYYYVYASTCQHVDFYRISYCDKAKALGLPNHDGHSPDGGTVDNTPGSQPGPSSSQPPASSANNSSSSHSHRQQQHHTMSTLALSEAGPSFVRDATMAQRDKHLSHHAALIPRSALREVAHPDHDDSNLASSLLDMQGYRSLNIDMPLDSQSSMSMEVTHDASHDNDTNASCMPIRRGSVSDMGTVRGHSPRKPIPSQWLSTRSGPNLATAQRAKERGHKQGSMSGSPVEVQSLRGTRSSVDIRKLHVTEGATFLTKEALAAVEHDITSPTSARSPTKHQLASSKPPWNSPNGSPLRESLRQQSAVTVRMSPTRATFLSAESTSSAHRRGTSSVATSNGDAPFRTAENSPVRSTAGSEHSFRSAAEVLDNDTTYTPHLNLSTNCEIEQAVQSSSVPQATAIKAATVGKASSARPKLSVRIPPTDARLHADSKSSGTSTSPTSTAILVPWSPTSPSCASRIPRVAWSSETGSACSPTRGSMLKRAQSTKSLTPQKSGLQQRPAQDLQQVPRLNTPTAVAVRHVRTVDSAGTTPIISRHPTAQPGRDPIDLIALSLERANLNSNRQLVPRANGSASKQTSRAPSVCVIKGTPAVRDPGLVDSAIIHSRKKSDASGTSHLHDTQDDAVSIASSRATAGTDNVSPVRGRAEQFIPTAHCQAGSVHSLQSSLASDLRATAPEFIPHTGQVSQPEKTEAGSSTPIYPSTDLLGAQAFDLDQFGIPWFYYMSQVQFAYAQGFQNGRVRSPKKARSKKQRFSISSPIGFHPTRQNATIPIQHPMPIAPPTPGSEQRRGSKTMPPSASTTSVSEQWAQEKRENSAPGLAAQLSIPQREDLADTDRPISPFAIQKAVIARQAAVTDVGSTLRDHDPNVDLTTIRNVGPPPGPRNMRSQNGYHTTIPVRGNGQYNSRHHRNRNNNHSDNGLYSYSYGGRGNVGVPIHDTIPFPNPVPPQGRPNGGQGQIRGKDFGVTGNQCLGYSVPLGSEACGTIDIALAAERGGGQACNACSPDH